MHRGVQDVQLQHVVELIPNDVLYAMIPFFPFVLFQSKYGGQHVKNKMSISIVVLVQN
jgi:hypothetical protein